MGSGAPRGVAARHPKGKSTTEGAARRGSHAGQARRQIESLKPAPPKGAGFIQPNQWLLAIIEMMAPVATAAST